MTRGRSALWLLAGCMAIASIGLPPAAAGSHRSLATCKGVPVTVTTNDAGDPIGNGPDRVSEATTNHRDVINLGGGRPKDED